MCSRKDERGYRTLGGRGIGMPQVVSKDLIKEVEVILGSYNFYRQSGRWGAVGKGMKLEMHA